MLPMDAADSGARRLPPAARRSQYSAHFFLVHLELHIMHCTMSEPPQAQSHMSEQSNICMKDVRAAWIIVSVCNYKEARARGSSKRKYGVRKGTVERRTWFSHASHDSMPATASVASAAGADETAMKRRARPMK